ncbi:MAG: Co2+/Mg2+ efflux protein ApaG [Hyphomicrobiaceae bacterium]|nr:Co2+/Mg2+ efflux protein ApaG [Hyphomicrobiaceae bacterium]
MYEAVTRGIRVRVTPEFIEDQSSPDESYFVWAYTVEIANEGEETVQLISRHWRITDGRGSLQEVRGPGVVGKTPVLAPGASFRYTSGCPLTTPSGIMAGSYQMSGPGGVLFNVEIPAFSLDSPFVRRSLN